MKIALSSKSCLLLCKFQSFFVVFQQGDRPQLSEEMDKILWDFVQKKGMDQKMFRSLVSFEVQHYYKQQEAMGSYARPEKVN